MGISIKNVVSNFRELENVVADIKNGYHGWKLDSDGLIAEQFINGREFTTFLVGSSTAPEHIKFYQPAERVFIHPCLKKKNFYPLTGFGQRTMKKAKCRTMNFLCVCTG